ncbi:24544_t:CDS:2 [Gigaspora margarita]|uniref:24544_t:CDS:1 n=1 Tax=Gigaspora margarita TaxID=4874 RepID=A0ABN7VQW0_GIGMA|nr:24544_t:CDS:2 [Gigaspora margarita]
MATYTYEDIPIDNNTIKYFFNANGNKLSYAEFIELLRLGDENFLDTFKKALNEATNKLFAYFWECPPIHKEMTNKPFEFVVTKSMALRHIKQDYSSFKEQIIESNNKDVCSFLSLGKDATLIVPIPCHNLDYKNISNFTKNASKEQQIKFWQEVAVKLVECWEFGTSKWLSTSGLGKYKQSQNNHSYNEEITLLQQSFNYVQQNPSNIDPKVVPDVEHNVESKNKSKNKPKNESEN